MHLVVGAGEFVAGHVSRALAGEVPIIELGADADDETLADAMTSVDVVHLCAETWSPARRLRFGREPSHLVKRILWAAQKSNVRRLVHLSTADVYGPDHFTRVNEKSRLRPVHAYERLKLQEERWLLERSGEVEVVVVRPARIFGRNEDWLLPYLIRLAGTGRIWLPGGGRALQTFIAAEDVGRACLAAAQRGRHGECYLVGGFDASWREFIESAARHLEVRWAIAPLPYDVAFISAMFQEALRPVGAPSMPSLYAVDAIGKPHYYDDSRSRRQLTWSPMVGSFDQAMPKLVEWLATLRDAAKAPDAPAAT